MLDFRLILSLFLLYFTACNFIDENDSSDDNTKNYHLVIYDSLQVTNNSLLFLSDYLPERKYYLFYDYFKGDILVVNENGEYISKLNYRGSSNTEYGELRGLSFLGQNKIIAYGTWNYYIYNMEGGFVDGGDILNKTVLVNPDYDFKAHHFTSSDSTLQLVIKGSPNIEGNVFTLDFYTNVKWATIFTPVLNKIKSGVTIIPSSIYTKKFFYDSSPHFALDAINKELLVLYPFEAVAYVYHLPDLSLKQTISLKPDFFSQAKGVAFSADNQKMKDESFQQAQTSGENIAIQALGSHIFLTYYRNGLPPDKVVKDMSSYMNNDLNNQRSKYLQFIKDGKKLCKDIKLPDGIIGLSIATGLDHIVLQANVSEELGFSKYYICKLVEI